MNPFGNVIFTILFLVICYLVNRGGISGGIEKFNKVGMPALFVMLVIVIIRSLTLDGAVEGLKFMFVPGYAVEGGFIEEAPNFITVLATAGGQMFFSLSLDVYKRQCLHCLQRRGGASVFPPGGSLSGAGLRRGQPGQRHRRLYGQDVYKRQVMPRDYDRMLRSIAQYEEKGMSREQAEIEAFYANTKV